MPPIDLLTAFLDRPKVIAYGDLGPVAGNVCVLHELSDKKKVIFVMLGEGPWNDLKYVAVNRKAIALPDTTRVHFHRGDDGTIGGGMTASSTGPDQGVDAFFADLPGALDKVTFSRYAWLALKLDPDPGAPGTDFELWARYEGLRVRIFDSAGVQTSFAWSGNPAWWICDFLIRKFIKRGARINEPLTAAEKLRFDWQSFVDAATWCDADIGGGVKRWSKGGLWFSEDVDAQSALEKMLLYCQCFLLEVDGKLTLVPDQARNSAFTFYAQDVVPGSFRAQEANVGTAKNRYFFHCRDINLASGSADELTRYAEVSKPFDHKAHQLATGVRGSGLSVQPNIEDAIFDFGVCSEEQCVRRLRFELWRQLGDDVAPGETYTPPVDAEWIGGEHGASGRATANTFPVRGDRVTIDRGVSEEYALDFEILEMKQEPDGRIAYRARQYMPNAFSDAMPATQAVQAPTPGAGLVPIQAVDTAGNQFVDPEKMGTSPVREEETVSRKGTTTATSFTTVASFPIKVNQPATFKGSLKCTKTVDPASTFTDSTPGTLANDATVGTIDWSPLSLASSAQVNASGVSKYLKITNWGFAIPSDHSILGMEAVINRSESDALDNIEENAIRWSLAGVVSGNDIKTAGVEFPVSPGNITRGGPTNLAGLTPAYSDINDSGFGIAISIKGVGGQAGGTGTIHAVTLNIYTNGGTYTMKARLKIGASLSAEVSITKPTTTLTQTVSVAVAPSAPDVATLLTVEVQAQVVTTNGGTVEGDFTQKRGLPSDSENVA